MSPFSRIQLQIEPTIDLLHLLQLQQRMIWCWKNIIFRALQGSNYYFSVRLGYIQLSGCMLTSLICGSQVPA